METAWPDPVERVASFLRDAGVEARLEQLADEAHTAAAVAEALGCPLEQIVKSLVFACGRTMVVGLVPGDRSADEKKVARLAGARTARMATPDEVLAATGFPPGGVAPFPLPRVQQVLVEQTLLSSSLVWVGAGSTRHLVALAPRDLIRLSRGEPADLVRESA